MAPIIEDKATTGQPAEIHGTSEGIGGRVGLAPIHTGSMQGPEGSTALNVCFILLLILLSFILPPIAVLIRTGLSWDFLISIILTILGWVPGIIYALIVTFVGPLFGARGAAVTRHETV